MPQPKLILGFDQLSDPNLLACGGWGRMWRSAPMAT